jgi:subtilisin family serine protease
MAHLVGQFMIDPVSGLVFDCTGAPGTPSSTGITDAQGQFNFLPGQSCAFKVGKITLGAAISIPSDAKVTPQDVAGVTRSATTAPSAVAIAQFLQSLDEKTESGKVVISSTSRDALNTNAVTELSLTSSSGAVSQEKLQSLVSVVRKTLVSPALATDALNRQIALNNVNISAGSVSSSSIAVLNSIFVTSATASQPVGLPVQMSAMGYYSNGSIADITRAVTWASIDESALIINASGLATGLKKGRVAVSASLKPAGSLVAVKGSMEQTTTDPVLTVITISNSNALPVGLTDQLIASGTFSDGTKADLTNLVTWTSSDPRILNINSQGLATGLLQGTVKVTANYLPTGASSAFSANYTETVLAPTVVNLVISYVQSALKTIQNQATALLQAVIVFSDKTTQTVSSLVTWTVSTFSGGGRATISPGRFATDNATLRATSPGVISMAASYLGLQSHALDLSITPLQPQVQNAAITLDVMGVHASTASGSVAATDPQGYPLSFSIQSDGAVGRATVDSGSGSFTYTVSGHTSASSDAFKVLVSNGKASSLATVTVTLKTDPLLQNQWHIQNQGFTAFASVLPAHANDMNVAGAWSMGYSGKGIKVAVIDTGLEVAHEDLAANVDAANSRNFLTGTSNPSPTVTGYDHGTQVAGIIGAVGFNGKGGRGVAYGATLRGYNFLKAQSTVNLANSLGLASYSADNDIFNESFRGSPTNLDPANESTYQAINAHLLTMRGGKGAILIQSAGNEFLSFNDGTTACSTANKYGVSCGNPATDARKTGSISIIVGALNSDGKKSSYSTAGSAIWVVAPGGEYGYDARYISDPNPNRFMPAMVTTALTGCRNAFKGTAKVNALDAQGQHIYSPQCQYTALMNGTSSAAPNLSGVVALMLEANPHLGYRDVKHILAKTAKKVDPEHAGVISTSVIDGHLTPVVLDQGWFQNAAGQWFSNSYGFGAVDASAAVRMAKNYLTNIPSLKSASLSAQFSSSVNVPNGNTTGSTLTFNMSPSFSVVEQVVVTVNITASPALTCNQIELSSPSGTKSILMHAGNGFSNQGVLQTSIPSTRFMSNAFYGESGAGAWTLQFLDFCNSTTRTTIRSTDMQTLSLTGH